MSDSSRIGISITANDSASVTLRNLQASARALEQALQGAAATATQSGANMVAALNAELSAVNSQIAALREQAGAIDQVNAAVSRSTSVQGANLGIIRQQQAASRALAEAKIREAAATAEAAAKAEDAARTEAEYINRNIDLIAREAQARAAAISMANRQAAAEEELNTRRMAEYTNRDVDLASRQTRGSAEYENTDRDLAAAKLRAEAEYINQTKNMEADKARAEAEYANQQIDLIGQKQRAEAEYINAGMDAEAAKARAEAEYINQNADLEAAQKRKMAEYENREFDLRAAAQSRTGAGIVAARSPAMAAGEAAGRVTARGGSSADAQIAGSIAASEAASKQTLALLAVAEAEQAAAAAGATAGEITAAGARAATIALNEQAAAATRSAAASRAGSGAGGISAAGNIFQRESRHIVGFFDSIARGQRGQAISSIGAAARDAGLGVASLATSMGALVAVMGAEALIRGAENMGKWAEKTRDAAAATGMSIDQYSRLEGAMGLIGVKAESVDASLRRLAVNLNTAIADPSSKAAEAFHNLGISQEQLVASGGNVGQVLNLVATNFNKYADGAAKSANLNQLFGRGFETLIPALQQGGEGLNELGDKAASTGNTLNGPMAESLIKVGEDARTLGETIEGSGKQAFEAWAPAIDEIIVKLTELIKVVGGAVAAVGTFITDIRNSADDVNNWINKTSGIQPRHQEGGWGIGDLRFGAHWVNDESNIKAAVTGGGEQYGPPTPPRPQAPMLQPQASPLQAMRDQMSAAALAAGQGAKTHQAAMQAEAEAEIAVMQKTLQSAQLNAAQREQIETELQNKQLSLRNSQLAQADSAAKAGAKEDYQAFAQGEQLKIAEAQGSVSKIVATYDEWISAAESRYKQHVSVIEQLEKQKVQAINTARLQEIKESATDTDQQNRLLGLNTQLSQMARGQYDYGGKEQTPQMLQRDSTQYLAQAAQVKAAADAEISALTQVRDTAEAGSSTQKQASAEIMQVLLASKQQEIDLYKKAGEAAQQAAQKAMQGFTQFFDSIGSGFQSFTNSLVKALIEPQQEVIHAGLTTITKSMRGTEIQQAFGQLVNHMVSSLADSLESAIGSTIAKALSGGAANSIGELLSQTFSKLLGNITGGALGSVAGTAAGGAAGNAAVSAAITAAATTETTGITTAITAATASQTASTTGAAATIVAAITATAATTDALLTANAVKPSIAGFSFAGGGIVPSAAGGMVTGGMGGQLAILHPQEMVLPKELSLGVQGMIRNQNANINYAPTINMASRGRQGSGMTKSEFSRAMSLHSGMMLGEARNAMRNGWRP